MKVTKIISVSVIVTSDGQYVDTVISDDASTHNETIVKRLKQLNQDGDKCCVVENKSVKVAFNVSGQYEAIEVK